MFRRWPFFQRLLSWTKPHAPAPARDARLRAVRLEQPARRGPELHARSSPGLMDGTSYFPSRPEMEANLARSRSAAGVGSPVRLPLDRDAPRRGPGRRTLRGRDDRRRLPLPGARRRGRRRRAVHAARPGDGAPIHYAEVRPAETYADRRVLIIGKQNSGFELATGLLPWARQIVLVSPSQAKLSVDTQDARRRPGALRPAVRGPRPRRRGQRPRRGDRPDRAGVRRPADRLACGAPTAAPTWPSRSTTSSPRPASWPAARPAGLGVADVRAEPAAGPDAVAGRARPCPASSSPGRSARAPRASRSTACRPTPGPSTAPATTPACSPRTSPQTHFGDRAGAAAPRARRDRRLHRRRAGRGARALPPARLPRPGADRRPGRRDARRGGPAARARPGRGRAGCARGDARGRRVRGDLPGHLLAHRRQGRGAGDRARSADAVRHGRCAADDRSTWSGESRSAG